MQLSKQRRTKIVRTEKKKKFNALTTNAKMASNHRRQINERRECLDRR